MIKKIIKPKSLKENITAANKIDYRRAEKLADDMEELLNDLGNLENISNYLSEYDFNTLGEACDILHDFAQMYASSK